MKKIMIMGILVAFIAGCASYNKKEYEQLTDNETKKLVEFASYNALSSDKITLEQRTLLESIEPSVKVLYEDDKEGKIFISWNVPRTLAHAEALKKNPYAAVPHKTINVRGYGNLTKPSSMSWSVSYVNQGDVVISKGTPPGTDPPAPPAMSSEKVKELKKL